MPLTIHCDSATDIWPKLPPAPDGRPLDILVHGRAGSGKTTFLGHTAARSVAALGVLPSDFMLTSHTKVATNRLVQMTLDACYLTKGVIEACEAHADRTLVQWREDLSGPNPHPKGQHAGTTVALKLRNLGRAKKIDNEVIFEMARRLVALTADNMHDETMHRAPVTANMQKEIVERFKRQLKRQMDNPDETPFFDNTLALSKSIIDNVLRTLTGALNISARSAILGKHPSVIAIEDFREWVQRKAIIPQTRPIVFVSGFMAMAVDELYRELLQKHEATDYVSVLLDEDFAPIDGVTVACFDEVQDYNHLLLRNARALSEKARYRFWAGDGDQSLYGAWAGGDIDLFDDMRRHVDVIVELDQCWRVGGDAFFYLRHYDRVIQPADWTKQIERPPFTYRPRPDWNTAVSFKVDPDLIFEHEFHNLPQHEGDMPLNDVMVVMRANVGNIAFGRWFQWCEARGLPYQTMGDPAFTCYRSRERQLALTLWELRQTVTGVDGAPYPMTVGRRRIVALLDRLGVSQDGLTIRPNYILGELPPLPSLDEAPLEPAHKTFMLGVLGRFGTLDAAKLQAMSATVRISTIHTAKGEDADNVIVDCRVRARRPLERRIVEEEKRAWNVATTRAKRHLFVLEGSGAREKLPLFDHQM